MDEIRSVHVVVQRVRATDKKDDGIYFKKSYNLMPEEEGRLGEETLSVGSSSSLDSTNSEHSSSHHSKHPAHASQLISINLHKWPTDERNALFVISSNDAGNFNKTILISCVLQACKRKKRASGDIEFVEEEDEEEMKVRRRKMKMMKEKETKGLERADKRAEKKNKLKEFRRNQMLARKKRLKKKAERKKRERREKEKFEEFEDSEIEEDEDSEIEDEDEDGEFEEDEEGEIITTALKQYPACKRIMDQE
ncbi:MAG: hypothetical protein ACTSUE_11255 [Promethearchaeota archaeon]